MTETLAHSIARLLPNGLGAKGDEERNPVSFPDRSLHVLVAVSGSVAAIKAPLIVNHLLQVRCSTPCSHGLLARVDLCSSSSVRAQHDRVDVQVVATKGASHFYDARELEAEHDGKVKVWTDEDEWAVRLSLSRGRASPRSRSLTPAPWARAGLAKDRRPSAAHRGECTVAPFDDLERI